MLPRVGLEKEKCISLMTAMKVILVCVVCARAASTHVGREAKKELMRK